MPLNKQRFMAGMALLGGAFGREIEGPISRLYYGILRDRFTDDEFSRAVETCCATETFWPSPAKLIQSVHGSAASQAEEALTHVQRVLRESGGHRFLSHERYTEEFDRPTREAIRAVGGLHEFANVTDDRWPGFVRRFREGYVTAAGPQRPQLADGGPRGPVRRVSSGMTPIARVVDDVPLVGQDKAAGSDR